MLIRNEPHVSQVSSSLALLEQLESLAGASSDTVVEGKVACEEPTKGRQGSTLVLPPGSKKACELYLYPDHNPAAALRTAARPDSVAVALY